MNPSLERRTLPFIGDLLTFRRDPNGFLLGLSRRAGDFARFRLGRRDAFLLSHPDGVRALLITNADAFAVGRMVQRAKRLLGDGLLTTVGAAQEERRRSVQPVFHRGRVAGYGAISSEYAERAASRWSNGAPVDIEAEMKRLMLAIVAKVLFGEDIEAQAEGGPSALGQALRDVTAGFPLLTLPFAEVLERLPIPAIVRVRRGAERLEKTVQSILAVADRGDLVTMLRSCGLEDRAVRDEAMNLLIAGHETTALAVTWAFHALSQNPGIEARLHAELDAGDADPPAYAERVLAEALRLYPPVSRIGRVATRDVRLGGHVVPAGSSVFASPFVTHHDPRWFQDPFVFDPERWTPEARAARPPLSYFPFGAGPRYCIGEHFGRTIALRALVAIARRWSFQTMPGRRVEASSLLTLRPRGGMPMTARCRRR